MSLGRVRSDAYDPGPIAPLSFLQAKAILMTPPAARWSGKPLMWLLVCLVSIATSDDFWSIAMARSGSPLLIVADDDDPGDSAERVPACASGDVGHTDLLWFVRHASEITGRDELRNGFVSRYGPRGPPADASDQQGRTNSFCFWPSAADSSIISPPTAAARHHSTLEALTPAACSRNTTPGANSYQGCMLSTCKSAVGMPCA